TPEQIENFLPRWCRACVSGDIRNAAEEDREAYITRQAAAIEQKLDEAIRYHRGICELAENPFLLTLLAIMQQNGIDLPPRRVELYAMLTRVLLETLNV